MRGTVSTACKAFQTTLKRVWASGSTYAEMTLFLGVSKDQLFRLRDRLGLALRLDRSQRKKPERHRDPTPAEIARQCAAIRAAHLERRRSEPDDRKYSRTHEFIIFKLERARETSVDPLEQLMDDYGDP